MHVFLRRMRADVDASLVEGLRVELVQPVVGLHLGVGQAVEHRVDALGLDRRLHVEGEALAALDLGVDVLRLVHEAQVEDLLIALVLVLVRREVLEVHVGCGLSRNLAGLEVDVLVLRNPRTNEALGACLRPS